MELSLINQELCESQLYRQTRSFGALNGKDIANLLYLNTLSTFLVSLSDQPEPAIEYAKKSSQNGTYTLFRTSASDMYMLAYALLNPGNDHTKIADPITSKRFLNSLNFDRRKHLDIVKRIGAGKDVSKDGVSYFFRLESQLKITDSRYKTWRRKASSLSSLSSSEQKSLMADLEREMRRITRSSSEIGNVLSSRSHQKSSSRKKEFNIPNDKASFARRAAGTAAGAIIGKQVGQTGLGAIAGYWASGARKQ